MAAMMRRYFYYCRQWCLGFVLVVLAIFGFVPLSLADSSPPLEGECELYLAPSLVRGWGVFAGRDFAANEIVHVAPRYFAFPKDAPVVTNGVLGDYIFQGSIFYNETTRDAEKLALVLFGTGSFFNHHAEPNLQFNLYRMTPRSRQDNIGQSMGFVSTKTISAGQELFIRYGDQKWFADRGIRLQSSIENSDHTRAEKEKYCSMIHAGIGKKWWSDHILAHYHPPPAIATNFLDRLSLQDDATAIVKNAVVAGSVLEASPALVVSTAHVRKTAMAPLAILWDDVHEREQERLSRLRNDGDLWLPYQDAALLWTTVDNFVSFSETALLPIGGTVSFVRRTKTEPNCRLEIEPFRNFGNGKGVVLKVVATKDLQRGEQLQWNLLDHSTLGEKRMLYKWLKQTGQLIPLHLQEAVRKKKNKSIGAEDKEL